MTSGVPRYVAQWDPTFSQLPTDHEKESLEMGCFWNAQGDYVCYSAKQKTFLETADFDQAPRPQTSLPLHPIPKHCAEQTKHVSGKK